MLYFTFWKKKLSFRSFQIIYFPWIFKINDERLWHRKDREPNERDYIEFSWCYYWILTKIYEHPRSSTTLTTILHGEVHSWEKRFSKKYQYKVAGKPSGNS